MNKAARRKHREKILAKRNGKFKNIETVDELTPSQKVAGRRFSWGYESFSTNEAIPTYEHRRGPVPGISPFRGSNYRHPRIKSLLVLADKKFRRYDEDTHLEPPARKKVRNLPYAFDDRQTSPIRNWKKHRKTQWKPLKGGGITSPFLQ